MSRVEPGLGEVVVEPAAEIWTINGRQTLGTNIVVGPEVVEQYRTGYRCLVCHAPQDEAFPEVCVEGKHPDKICTYRIRDNQARDFALQYQGEKHYGPTPLDDGDEETERQLWTPKTGVLIPRSLND